MPPELPIYNLLKLTLKAAAAVTAIYYDERLMGHHTLKKDASPLTLADKASHDILAEGLQSLTPGIPLLSEEGAGIPWQVRSTWEYFWCVDPLDGTKEFLRRNDEFTVNVALVYRQQPVFGIICSPVSQALYYGSENGGSWKILPGETPLRLQTSKRPKDWTALCSRSHASAQEQELLQRYPVTNQMVAGSSLKFCLIAEGAAQLYYRDGPTMEWDTAAGHAIVQYSGGQLSTPAGTPFLYNKESLLNGPFICTA